MAESLPHEEVLFLYGCCDVFLSLLRSEGFGRGMAEALQLCLDVIETDFEGNTDFCTGPLAHQVRWREAPAPRGIYPQAEATTRQNRMFIMQHNFVSKWLSAEKRRVITAIQVVPVVIKWCWMAIASGIP